MAVPSGFFSTTPTDTEIWRAIIAFGQNTATYKFAFGATLLELARDGKTRVTTEDLARPFALGLCRHLKQSPSQITRKSAPRAGSFLATCIQFNEGQLDEDHLLRVGAKKGFTNVIDAFQNLPGLDQRPFYSGSVAQGISFHDSLLRLAAEDPTLVLDEEVEARWRLVESAWNLNLPASAIEVRHDASEDLLYLIDSSNRRCNLTRVRAPLNAYQKGACFYCGTALQLDPESHSIAHVDHFLPHRIGNYVSSNLNGIWNLVLACPPCNLSKSGSLPHATLAERWLRRNEWYCASKHPLSNTIALQTGNSEAKRRKFLEDRYSEAVRALGVMPTIGWRAP